MNFVRQGIIRSALAGLLLLAFTAAGAYAQNGESLGKSAIPPFSGGSAGGQEGIPELFAFSSEMLQNFDVIPRTAITKAARSAAKDKFLRNSGIAVGFGGGFGIYGNAREDIINGGGVGGDIELRLFHYLGIQIGANYISYHVPYMLWDETEEQYEIVAFLQIPLLVRLNLDMGSLLSLDDWTDRLPIAIFAGVGMNSNITTPKSPAVSGDPGSMSLIFGVDLGLGGNFTYSMLLGNNYGGNIIERPKDERVYSFYFVLGYRFIGGIGSLHIVNGASYDYSMGIHMITLGLRLYIPFR